MSLLNNSSQFLLVKLFEWLLFISLLLWLIYSALVLKVEYYDGFDAIMNIARFTGEYSTFIGNRAPLMSMLLVPAEIIKESLSLNPLDLRAYHLTSAILHMAYAFGVYIMLIRACGRTLSVFMAFLFAIPSYLFFSYSPFISHDIIPGGILLAMIILAENFRIRRQLSTWLLLVLLGAAAALIKHIYGLFWVAIISSYIIVMLASSKEQTSRSWNEVILLASGAITSGLMTWLYLAWVLSADPTYKDTPILAAPLKQIVFLATGAAGSHISSLDIYLKNSAAYGILAVILLPAGVVMSLRGSNLQRVTAITFLFITTVMHIMPFREVRYLAHLSPLLAFIIIPPIQYIIEKWRGAYLLVLALLLTMVPINSYSALNESLRIFHPFYQRSPYQPIIQTLKDTDSKPLLINWNMLEFVSPIASPLSDDPYHRYFHFGMHHLYRLTGFQPSDIIFTRDDSVLWLEDWPDKMAILIKNPNQATSKPNEDLRPFHQKVLISDSLHVKIDSNMNISQSRKLQEYKLGELTSKNNIYYLEGERLGRILKNRFLPNFRMEGTETIYRIKSSGENQFEVVGLYKPPEITSGLHASIRYFSITDTD